jgi:group I intron endonuclease
MGYIYRIKNLITKKCYIGETKEKDPLARWKGHQEAFKHGKGCPALRDAVQKYGIENFKFEVLIVCFDDDRFHYEKEYIKKLNTIVPNGYNILPGGIGGAGFKGKTHTEEVRKKLREASQKYYENPENRTAASQRTKKVMEGVNVRERMEKSEKWKKALEEGRVGGGNTTRGDDLKKRISESLKRYYSQQIAENKQFRSVNIEKHRQSQTRALGKRVQQLSLENQPIQEFPSVAEAARQTGVGNNNIKHCVGGQTKTAGGFRWVYV